MMEGGDAGASDTAPTADTLPETDSDTELSEYPYYRLLFTNAMNNCNGDNDFCVARVNLRINGAWQENGFPSLDPCSGKLGSFAVDLRASSSWDQAPDPCEDVYCGPFMAFDNSNSSWCSLADSVTEILPYATSEWLEMNFGAESVVISCLKILGGERGMIDDCAPYSYHLEGSHDGWTWSSIPGSEHSAGTENLVTYCFQPLERPHEPYRFEGNFHGARVNFRWEAGSGDEAGYLLVRGTVQTPFVPVDGESYTPGPAGAGTILFVGDAEAFSDTDVVNGTEYYYALYAYNSANKYSVPARLTGTVQSGKTHRYYRFVIDSNYGWEEAQYSNALLESLELQIDGVWAKNYKFAARKGTIDGKSVRVTASSETGTNYGYNVFGPGRWTTETGLFDIDTSGDALVSGGVYLQLDFSGNPVEITGWRAKSTNLDPDFPSAPDATHLQYSNLGTNWHDIAGSYSKDVLWEETTREWQ